ncbi:3006_t:CDS:2 [Ambispora leptoticha]|uniref:3006_t:CDS:1 n=1 Tax=Ambispora leptoticha TaxID=144679 RepID=A0A9N9F019_9GLOM|nr:3006_t:CDS:2 [Ambispora leptoticha]
MPTLAKNTVIVGERILRNIGPNVRDVRRNVEGAITVLVKNFDEKIYVSQVPSNNQVS